LAESQFRNILVLNEGGVMKSHWLRTIFTVFIASFLVFGLIMGCKNKTPKEKPKVSGDVFQRIKVTNAEGVILEVKDPEIDYSLDDKTPESESFGIRIKSKDQTETITWNEIKHIDITKAGKDSMNARLKLADGTMLDVDLVKDSKGGLSGTTDSGVFQIPLSKVKSIEVIER
jgi:hypothetical protein